MLSTTRGTPVTTPAPGVIPDTTSGPVSQEPPAAVPNTARAREAAAAANRPETSAEHFRREASVEGAPTALPVLTQHPELGLVPVAKLDPAGGYRCQRCGHVVA